MHKYRVFGISIKSDMELPLQRNVKKIGSADLIIRENNGLLIQVDECPMIGKRNRHGRDVIQAYKTLDGSIILKIIAVGYLKINSTGSVLEYLTEYKTIMKACIISVGLGAVFYLRNNPTLHCSAIEMDKKAVVFLGEPKAGKSTLATALYLNGFSFLTDDQLPVKIDKDKIVAGPGFSLIKHWPNTIRHVKRLGSYDWRLVPGTFEKQMTFVEENVSPGCYEIAAICYLKRSNITKGYSMTRMLDKRKVFLKVANSFYVDFINTRGGQHTSLSIASKLAQNVPTYEISYTLSSLESDQFVNSLVDIWSVSI